MRPVAIGRGEGSFGKMKYKMLEIQNLGVEKEGKKILNDVNLRLEKGKVYVLMGKNGSGKSTLANVVMGNPKYGNVSGEILFEGEDILHIPVNERAKKGIFLSFQTPVEIHGVTFSGFLRSAHNSLKRGKLSFLEFQNLLLEKAANLGIDKKQVEGYINHGFSGGEKKKSEVLQAMVLSPKFIILDEIDSGLDIDSLKKVSSEIRKLATGEKTILIITHYRKILDYLSPDGVFVMDNGKIVIQGKKEIIDKIDKQGYEWIKKENPKINPKIFESKLLISENATPNVKHLTVAVPEGFEFNPGQYLSLSVPHEGKKYRSPFSIATFPNNGKYADFFIKLNKNGRTSEFVKSLKKNDRIELFGPLGKFAVNENSKNRDLIFISSGTGITAFMSMIPSLFSSGFGKKAILIKGFRNEGEILYEKEFLELRESHENFEFHNILSQPKNKDFSDKGYVQDFLEKYIPENFHGDFYICGLKEMVDSVREKLLENGVGRERIFFEKYD